MNMNKRGFFGAFFVVLFLIAMAYAAYYLYQNIPRHTINLINTNSEQVKTTNTIPSKQFYENMRYPSNLISYNIAESCPENKKNIMKEAFSILEEKTILEFNPSDESTAILKILCSDISPEAEEENHFIAGEGGPSKVINSTLYSVILEGKVALYREGSCNNANVAIHELLHALGFDHNKDKNSILYPTLACNQIIDEEIIESINDLYEIASAPDLAFEELTATKSGRYLNFHMEVINKGLIQTNNVKVGLYSDGEFVDDFELNSIAVGAKKIIDVENLKVPLAANDIEFVIDYQNQITEISEDNNRASLSTN
ncbi:matrixin family metalloprotease [Candidatus Pacearchaeota archaeon]|nr:matrixin family metalloprotease [Candidatus Pacearchaeota archaeon]